MKDSIPDLLQQNIPKELLMSVEDALRVGAQRAYFAAEGMNRGHLASVMGQMRHFHMNESFHVALTTCNAQPSAIRGNGIIRGRSGIVNLARFNSSVGSWNNSRRSLTRRQMSLVNQAIEPLVLGDLFDHYEPASNITAFFVATFSGSMHVQPELPLSIHLAVPDGTMHGWLFKEPVQEFLERYKVAPESQPDNARPKLKKLKKPQNPDDTAS